MVALCLCTMHGSLDSIPRIVNVYSKEEEGRWNKSLLWALRCGRQKLEPKCQSLRIQTLTPASSSEKRRFRCTRIWSVIVENGWLLAARDSPTCGRQLLLIPLMHRLPDMRSRIRSNLLTTFEGNERKHGKEKM